MSNKNTIICSNCGNILSIANSQSSICEMIDRGWRSKGNALYCPVCAGTWKSRNGTGNPLDEIKKTETLLYRAFKAGFKAGETESSTKMLTLQIKKKWYDMILSGEKKEEYREIKPYYISRFSNIFSMYSYSHLPYGCDKQIVKFKNGYKKDSPFFTALCTLDVKTGKEEWGAVPGVDYYVLTIEEIIKND